MSDVLFKKPDGSFVYVDSSEAASAQADGYVPATPEQLTASNQTGRAFVEGAARGASMGLSDPFLKGFGVEAQGLKARKEENPIASGAGELAGAVGTSLATGGGASALVGGGLKGAAFESGMYGMGSLISEGALENRPVTVDRLAAGFVGGALAGGAVHGGMTVIGKGASAIMSKVGGSTLKDSLAKSADEIEWNALKRSMPDSWVKRNEPFKDDILRAGRASGALGTAKSAFDQESLAKALLYKQDTGRVVGEQLDALEGFVPLRGNKELRSEFADFVEKRLGKFKDSPAYDDALKDTGKYIDSIREVDRNWSGVWGDIQSTLFKDADPTKTATAEVREEIRRAMRDFVFDEVASGKNKAAKVLTADWAPETVKSGRGSKAMPWLSGADVNLDESVTAGGVLRVPKKFSGNVFDNPNAGPRPETTNAGELFDLAMGREIQPSSTTIRLEVLDKVPGGIFIDPTGEAITTAASRGASSQPLAAARQLSGPEIEALAANWQGKQPLSVALGEAETRIPGMVFDTPAKQSPAWLGAQMRQTGRDYAAASALASAFEKRTRALDKNSLFGLDSLGAGFIGQTLTGSPIGAVASAVAKKQMERRGSLLSAAALRALSESSALKGAGKALQQRFSTIMSIAPEVLGAYRFPLAQAAAISADALLEEHLKLASGPTGADYMAKMALPAESPEEVDGVGKKIAILDALNGAAQDDDKEIDALFGSAPGRKGSVGSTMSLKEFNEVKARLSASLTDPAVAFENIPADMRAVAPGTTSEAMASSLGALKYLDSKMPKDPYEGMPESVRPQWQPSPADLDRFNRVKEAVERPAQVLKNMANGYIAPEQVEALKAVYPALYSDLQQKIGERLATWQKPLSYQQKLAFSAILGSKALGMSPQQVQILQQSMASAQGAQQQGAGGKPSKPDGRQDVNEAQIQTEAQKLEARS